MVHDCCFYAILMNGTQPVHGLFTAACENLYTFLTIPRQFDDMFNIILTIPKIWLIVRPAHSRVDKAFQGLPQM